MAERRKDRKADLLIHAYVDDIMTQLMERLDLTIPQYSRLNDPTLTRNRGEWTILDSEVQWMRRRYEMTCCRSKRKAPAKSEGKRVKKENGLGKQSGDEVRMKEESDKVKTMVKVEEESDEVKTAVRVKEESDKVKTAVRVKEESDEVKTAVRVKEECEGDESNLRESKVHTAEEVCVSG